MSTQHAMSYPVDSDRRLVCGYPKTGRTWLRFMMASALSKEFELDLDINLNNVYSVVPNEESATLDGQPTFGYKNVLPKIEMSHRIYQQEFSEARLVFMTRDPRDVMVSHWLHDTLQVKIFDGTLSEYVRNEKRGISAFLGHLETWSPNIDKERVVTYENMRTEPEKVLSRIFEQLDVKVALGGISYAVQQGDINRMRKIEVESGIAGHDYDRSNPEARRIRAGKIGGFVRYLNESDVVFIDQAIRETSESTQRIIELTPYPLNHE